MNPGPGSGQCAQRYLIERTAIDLLRLETLDAKMALGTISDYDGRSAHALRNTVRLALHDLQHEAEKAGAGASPISRRSSLSRVSIASRVRVAVWPDSSSPRSIAPPKCHHLAGQLGLDLIGCAFHRNGRVAGDDAALRLAREHINRSHEHIAHTPLAGRCFNQSSIRLCGSLRWLPLL